MRTDIPLPDCIRYLKQMQDSHSKPDLIGRLIAQCNSYKVYRSMGPRILETIAEIER
jgi:hypothetical protein